MAMVVRLFCSLLLMASMAGSSDVFGAVGNSVQLDVQDLSTEFTTLSWVFNGTKPVLEYIKIPPMTFVKPSTDYKGRVEFNNKTYSLTLKNLQKTDSGLYEVKASGVQASAVTLSVIDPVEKPDLNHQPIPKTCNTTLTCRSHAHSINSSCYNSTCEELEEHFEDITLSLFVKDDHIICNLSNKVSWEYNGLKLEELRKHCPDHKGPNPAPRIPWYAVIIGVVIIGLVVGIIFFVIKKFCWKTSSDSSRCDNTLYAEVTNSATLPMTTVESPSTLYSVVGGKAQPPSNTEPTSTPPNPENQRPSMPADNGMMNTYESVPDMKSLESKPETIYATVNKTVKNEA